MQTRRHVPKHRRGQRFRPDKSRLAVESLEPRALLAVLTVGPGGQFATIQLAVDNAGNNDEIILYSSAFDENVDLSRLGIAAGSLPTNVIFRGTDDQTAIAPTNGSGFSNSAPLNTHLTFDGIKFTSANATPADSGISLSQFQGSLTVIDSLFEVLGQSGILLRNIDADLRIENNTFRDIGNGNGDHAIDIGAYRGQGSISFNTIQDTTDTGIVFANSGDEISSLLINENNVTGDSSFFATTNVGLSASLAGTTKTDLSLDRNTFDAMADTGITLDAADDADVHTRWTRNVVSNVNGAIGIAVQLDDNSTTAFTALQNTIADTRNDGMGFRLSDGASLRGILRQNAFLSVGDGAGDDGLTVLADASSTGSVDLQLAKNDFTTITGIGLELIADGAADWHAFISENFFTETNSASGAAAFVLEQPAATSSADIDLVMTDNVVLDAAAAAYALHQDGSGNFRLEGTAATAAAQIAATNTGEPIVVDGTVTLIAPNSNLADMPLLIGDRVWIDVDGDGIQDQSEPGLARVTMSLSGTEAESGSPVSRSTQTDEIGAYFFGGLAPGDYTVSIDVPNGFLLTAAEQGADGQVDSDPSATTATTEVTLLAGTEDLSIDAGLLITWQNPSLKFDVNADGFAAPGDVLIVINELNRNGSRKLTLPAFGLSQPPPYYDANGDEFITSFDALVIINYLNGVGSGEGEAAIDIPLWLFDSVGSGNPANINPDSETVDVDTSFHDAMPIAVPVAQLEPEESGSAAAPKTVPREPSILDLALIDLFSG